MIIIRTCHRPLYHDHSGLNETGCGHHSRSFFRKKARATRGPCMSVMLICLSEDHHRLNGHFHLVPPDVAGEEFRPGAIGRLHQACIRGVVRLADLKGFILGGISHDARIHGRDATDSIDGILDGED